MIEFFRKRRGVSIALAAVAVVLLGCTSGTICAKRYNKAEGQYEIQYKSDVDADGNGGKVSDWIKVDKPVYQACGMGEKWPACKEDAKDEEEPKPDPEVNPPRRDPDRDAQDRNARTVCFDFVSDPKRKLRYKWRTPRREKGPREGTWGIFTDCIQAEIGHVVNMTVEHITGPSTLMCAIYIIRGGKKVPIDLVITQAFGDCKVSAVVPPN